MMADVNRQRRAWRETLTEHGLFMGLFLFLGPLSVLHGAVALFCAESSESQQVKIDFNRWGLILLLNGAVWSLVGALWVIWL